MSETEAKFPRLSPWRQAEMLERAAMGEPSLRLAKKFGLHRATVNRLIARYLGEAKRQVQAKQKIHSA